MSAETLVRLSIEASDFGKQPRLTRGTDAKATTGVRGMTLLGSRLLLFKRKLTLYSIGKFSGVCMNEPETTRRYWNAAMRN